MSASAGPLAPWLDAALAARRRGAARGARMVVSAEVDPGLGRSLEALACEGRRWLMDTRAAGGLPAELLVGVGSEAELAASGPGRFDVVARRARALFEELTQVGEEAPRLVGGAGFEPRSTLSLRLPRIAWRRTAERATIAVALRAEELDDLDALAEGLRRGLDAAPRTGAERGAPRVVEDGVEGYARAVEAALAAIDLGKLEKVVVARRLALEVAVDPAAVACALEGLEGTVRIADLDAAGTGWVAATPELLVERRAGEVRSEALAGSLPRGEDVARERGALLESDKDRREHELVLRHVEAALRSFGLVPRRAPLEVLSLPRVHHLRTRVHAVAAVLPTALAVAGRLHPTPAMAGVPRGEAERFIAEHETAARGPYAAPFGWVDAEGDGLFVVGIRGAELEPGRVVLRAGTGIVRGSTVEAELAETEAKLASMRAALARAS